MPSGRLSFLANSAMPNLKKHIASGALVAGGANLVCQLVRLYTAPRRPESFLDALANVKWGRVAMFAAAGATIAALPDILEPARHPNHRAFFHSVCCCGALAYGAFGKHSKGWTDDNRDAASASALAYISHLLLDAGTPKSLPFI